MKCRHSFVPTPRASTPSKMLPGEMIPAICALCRTRYPCRDACDHVDCRVERGEPLPEFVSLVDEDNPFGESP
jgi:hypothetical protein